MSNVSFNLIDAGYRFMYPEKARVFWNLNDTATNTAGNLISKRSVGYTPNAQGDVTCTIADTESMWDDRWYTLEIQYLDSDAGMSQLESPPWKIRVPGGSHELVNLIDGYTSPSLTWVGTDYPPVPLAAYWLNPVTGDFLGLDR